MDYNFSDYKTTEEKKEEAKRDRKNNLFYPLIIAVIAAIIGPLLSSAITFAFQNKNTVKDLAVYFDSVEENMELEHALDLIYKESEETKDENEKLKNEAVTASNEKDNLKNELNGKPETEIFSPALVVEGLKKESSIGKGVAIIDGNTYYSAKTCSLIWGKEPKFEKESNTISFSLKGNTSKETKVDLIDANVIYDGHGYEIITPSSDNTLCMGSDEFNKGFIIYKYYYSDGYILLDLKGKYSKISFDVARITGSNINDATLRAFIGDDNKKEYALIGEKPIERITIDLNYANSLKLQIDGNGNIYYGFANCTLEK